MGFFSSIKKKVKSTISSATDKIHSAVSTAKSNISSFASTASAKIKSGATIVGTNVKNSFSKESIKAFVKGVAEGGLINGIASAAMNTAVMSMTELDKSGEWNPEYEYKLHDFPDKSTYDTALSYGIDDYGQWKAFEEQNKTAGGSLIQEVEVIPATEAESVSSSTFDNVGNIVVTPAVSANVVKTVDTPKKENNSETGKLLAVGAVVAKIMGVI